MMKPQRHLFIPILLICAVLGASCSRQEPNPASSSVYPMAVDPSKVGKYPALTKSGGGYFYDEVLEYRVWIHPGGDDYYRVFSKYEEAEAFSKQNKNAEQPLVLVLQREHINEHKPGQYVHVKEERITEWQVEWLKHSKRGLDSIANFLKTKTERRAQRPASEDGEKPPQSR
jgi:hypothetical protein